MYIEGIAKEYHDEPAEMIATDCRVKYCCYNAQKDIHVLYIHQ